MSKKVLQSAANRLAKPKDSRKSYINQAVGKEMQEQAGGVCRAGKIISTIIGFNIVPMQF